MSLQGGGTEKHSKPREERGGARPGGGRLQNVLEAPRGGAGGTGRDSCTRSALLCVHSTSCCWLLPWSSSPSVLTRGLRFLLLLWLSHSDSPQASPLPNCRLGFSASGLPHLLRCTHHPSASFTPHLQLCSGHLLQWSQPHLSRSPSSPPSTSLLPAPPITGPRPQSLHPF